MSSNTFHIPTTVDRAWRSTLRRIQLYGREIAPRGKKILELDHHTMCVMMDAPVLLCPARKINYKFMAAEALWILRGSDLLGEIEPYNKRMAEFSDDGFTLAGAYGPRIASQVPYVVDKLVEDRDTRQATLVIWQPSPPASKDIPCTVAMDFKIREGALDAHVFMRSSDAWLGVPYDVFSFTCVALYVLNLYNHVNNTSPSKAGHIVTPGRLFLTAASSHLYGENIPAASTIWQDPEPRTTCPLLPMEFYDGTSIYRYPVEGALTRTLTKIRDGEVDARWWL